MNNNEIKALAIPKDQMRYEQTIATGQKIIADGGSKADSARAMYELMIDESREVLIRAFIEGATVTEKGAPTYFYNTKRKFDRKTRAEKPGQITKKDKTRKSRP